MAKTKAVAKAGRPRMESYTAPDLLTGVQSVVMLTLGHAMRAFEKLGARIGDDRQVVFSEADPDMTDDERKHCESVVLAATKQLLPSIEIVVGANKGESAILQILNVIGKATDRVAVSPSQLFLEATADERKRTRAKKKR